MLIKCKGCVKLFDAYPSSKRMYCSHKCHANSMKGKPTWNKNIKGDGYKFKGEIVRNNCKCKQCGKLFHLKPFAIKRGRGNFCSHPCYWESRKEHMKGEGNPQFGQSWGKLEGNPNWRGGISNLPYSIEFTNELKLKIRIRDNFECQSCLMSEEDHIVEFRKSLTIHHIDYNKNNCSKNNLASTCCICNSRANFNRGKWKKFFQERRLSNERN